MADDTWLARSRKIELITLMRELKRERVLRANKQHLLELVEYTNDASGAWKSICEAFENVGGDADDLYGMRLPHGDVVLIVGEPGEVAAW